MVGAGSTGSAGDEEGHSATGAGGGRGAGQTIAGAGSTCSPIIEKALVAPAGNSIEYLPSLRTTRRCNATRVVSSHGKVVIALRTHSSVSIRAHHTVTNSAGRFNSAGIAGVDVVRVETLRALSGVVATVAIGVNTSTGRTTGA